MIIRSAQKLEAKQIAELMNLAMLEITYQFIAEENSEKANDFLAYFIAQEDNQYSYQNIFVAEENDQIVGQISLYDGADLHRLRKPIWRSEERRVGKESRYWLCSYNRSK